MADKIKIIVLDILKPHKPDIIEFGRLIKKSKGVKCVNMSVYAVDEKTESVKLAIDGSDLNFNKIKKTVEEHGAVIHSIDKVVIGESRIITVPDLK